MFLSFREVVFFFREVDDVIAGYDHRSDVARPDERPEFAGPDHRPHVTGHNERPADGGISRPIKNYRVAFTAAARSENFSRHVARKSPELPDSSVHLRSRDVISVVRRLKTQNKEKWMSHNSRGIPDPEGSPALVKVRGFCLRHATMAKANTKFMTNARRIDGYACVSR